MIRIAIIAALPGELKPLVRGWHHERRGGADVWRRQQGAREWVGACAGVGAAAAARAFAEVEREGRIDLAISAGWAGAAAAEFATGRAYHVSGLVDARTGERFRVAVSSESTSGECWLATSSRVADPAEKRRLAAAFGAGLVDMEAAEIARLAAARGIPVYCVKGVSDGPADLLPDFNPFISEDGQWEGLRFIAFALGRPKHWPALLRLANNSRKAARHLRDRLLEVLNP